MNEPWPAFPTYLNCQLGYVPSPTWIAAVDAGTAVGHRARRHRPVPVRVLRVGRQRPPHRHPVRGLLAGRRPELGHRRGPPLPRRHRGAVHPRRPGPQPGAARPATSTCIQTDNGVEIDRPRGRGRHRRHDPRRARSRSRPSYLLINNLAEVGGQPEPVRRHPGPPGPRHGHQQRGAQRGPRPPAGARSPTGRSRPGVDRPPRRHRLPGVRPRRRPGPARGGRGRDRRAGADRLQDDERPVQPHDRRAPEGDVGGGRVPGHASTRSRRASSSTRPSPATSRSSAGATTAASTPTSSSCGGRSTTTTGHRPELRPDHRRRGRPPPRRDPHAHRRGRARRRRPRTSTGYFAENVFNVWNNWVFWGLAHDDNVFNVAGHDDPGRAGGRPRHQHGRQPRRRHLAGEIFESPAGLTPRP